MRKLGDWFGRRSHDRQARVPAAPVPPPAPPAIVPDIEAMGRPPIVSQFLRPSFSQLGEDRTLWWLLGEKQNGFYVDIGCNHPFNYSNTALLHLRNGWSGVNVDLDPRSIALFEEARPGDCNIVAAVGREESRMEATIFAHSSEMNTLGAPTPDLEHLPHETHMVDVLPLSTLLDRHVPRGTAIDFLNIDVEGFDYQVLLSNDWTRYQPAVIAVEVPGHNLARLADDPVHVLLSARNYILISHTVITSIYRMA